MSEQGSEELVTALTDADPSVRERAIAEMGNRQDPSFLPCLLEALVDPFPAVRWRAVRSLGRIGIGNEVVQLLSLLKDESPRVRAEVVRALGETADHRFLEDLKPLLDDPDVHVRCLSIEAMAQIGAPGEPTVARFVDLLADQDSRVRMHAAASLGMVGDSRSVSALVLALKDPNHRVRGLAAWSLGMLRDTMSIEPLLSLFGDDGEFVTLYAYQAVAGLAQAAIPVIETALLDGASGANAMLLQRLRDQILSEAREPGQTTGDRS